MSAIYIDICYKYQNCFFFIVWSWATFSLPSESETVSMNCVVWARVLKWWAGSWILQSNCNDQRTVRRVGVLVEWVSGSLRPPQGKGPQDRPNLWTPMLRSSKWPGILEQTSRREHLPARIPAKWSSTPEWFACMKLRQRSRKYIIECT